MESRRKAGWLFALLACFGALALWCTRDEPRSEAAVPTSEADSVPRTPSADRKVEAPSARHGPPLACAVIGGVAVSGTVVDAWGGPVEGASVAAEPSRCGTRSDAEGRFSLTLRPGSLQLIVRADGYASAARRIVAPYAGLVFQLLPESTVFGRVEMRSTGAPVVGAALFVNETPTEVRTDEAGRFSLEGLSPGPLVVTARGEGALAISDALVLTLASSRGPLVLEAFAAASIFAELSGGPCDGGTLVLTEEADDEVHVTEVRGTHVSALGLVPGRYAASASCPGGPLEVAFGSVTLEEGRNAHRWVIPRGGVVRGRVETSTGEPAADVRVQARLEPDALSVGRSGEDGSFALFGLPDGTATVVAYTATGLKSAAVEARVGEQDVVVTLSAEGTIVGTVVDQAGSPVADVQVEASGGTKARATSAGDGSFVLEGLRAGDYDVSATDWDAHTQAHVEEGAEVEVELVVSRTSGSISGTVVGPEGAVVPDAYVYATAERAFNPVSPWPAVHAERWRLSDDEGHFALEDLGAAAYVIQAETKDGLRGTVLAVPLPREDLSVRVEEDGRLAGRVEGLDLDPPRFAIEVRPVPKGRTREQVVLDEDGAWSMEGLPAGRYVIDVRAGSRGGHVEPFDLAAGESKTDIVVVLEPAEVLRGRVVDVLSGEPIAGVRMLADGAGGFWGASQGDTANVTDARGVYTVEAPPAGLSFTVMTPVPYQPVSRAVTPSEDGTVPDVVLAPLRVASGVKRGSLGFGVRCVEAEDATRCEVSSLTPGGRAEQAGIEVGASVASVDGVDVREHPADVCRTLLVASVGQVRTVGFEGGSVVRFIAE